MAKINATVGVTSGTITGGVNAPGITNSGWGIDSFLSNYIIQNLTVNHTSTYDATQDQKGLTIGELDYDENWELTMTVVGNSTDETGEVSTAKVGETFTFNDHTYKVRSTQFAGTYNGKKQWNITAISYKVWPLSAS